MLLAILNDARKRSHRHQGGFTLVELLVVIAILGVLAAIVLFTIQGAADLYWNTYGVYPVGQNTPATIPGVNDVVTPAAGAYVNEQELLMANLLHSATTGWNTAAPPPAGTEIFTYKASPPQGTVHGAIQGQAC